MFTKCVVVENGELLLRGGLLRPMVYFALALALPRTDGRSRNRLDYDSTGSLSDALGRNGQTVGYRRAIQGRWGGVS